MILSWLRAIDVVRAKTHLFLKICCAQGAAERKVHIDEKNLVHSFGRPSVVFAQTWTELKSKSDQGETDSPEEENIPPMNQVIINTKIKSLSPWKWYVVNYWTQFKRKAKEWTGLSFTLLISTVSVWFYYTFKISLFFGAIKCFFQKGKQHVEVNRRWILAITCKTDIIKYSSFVVLGMTSKNQKHIRIFKWRALNLYTLKN